MRRALVLIFLAVGCTSASIGGPCVTSSDCNSISASAWCSKVSVCTLACGLQPDGTTAPSCPTGSVCVPSSTRSVCLMPCTSDSQCRKGWSCNDSAGGKACQYTDFLNEPQK